MKDLVIYICRWTGEYIRKSDSYYIKRMRAIGIEDEAKQMEILSLDVNPDIVITGLYSCQKRVVLAEELRSAFEPSISCYPKSAENVRRNKRRRG